MKRKKSKVTKTIKEDKGAVVTNHLSKLGAHTFVYAVFGMFAPVIFGLITAFSPAGFPAALGVLLAKALGWNFEDTETFVNDDNNGFIVGIAIVLVGIWIWLFWFDIAPVVLHALLGW